MKDVLDASVMFFIYAVVAVFAQNAVFTRGLGVSRLVQLVGSGSTAGWQFGLLLGVTQVMAAPLAYYANLRLIDSPYRAMIRPLVYILCIAAVCAVQHLVLLALHADSLVRMLPLAALNSCVLGTVLVERTQSFTLPQSLGFGFGSAVGYMMAVMLVDEARRRLRRRTIPKAFRGLPITLVYIGILALGIYAFTGHTVIL